MPTSGISSLRRRRRGASSRRARPRRPSSGDRRGSSPQRASRRPVPALLRGLVGDVGDLAPVVARVRDEVLEDHLLDVAVARRGPSASASSAATRSSSLSPIPTRIPLVNGIRSSPAASIVSRRTRRVLGRRALVDDEVRVGRLEHQPLRGGHLAQPGEVLAARHAEVGVREHARARARARRPRRRRRRSRRARTTRRRSATTGLTSGSSPVSTSSSLALRRTACSRRSSTSSGE